MLLTLRRTQDNGKETAGEFFMNEIPLCDTLEDEKREVKVKGETRIPAGKYKIKLRTEGTTHAKYAERFPDMHKGMLWLQDVPGFEYILIHIGNTDEDTMGCILVGTIKKNRDGRMVLIESTRAYQRIYPLISKAILRGEDVEIEVIDEK